jgi:hypothetical protein
MHINDCIKIIFLDPSSSFHSSILASHPCTANHQGTQNILTKKARSAEVMVAKKAHSAEVMVVMVGT